MVNLFPQSLDAEAFEARQTDNDRRGFSNSYCGSKWLNPLCANAGSIGLFLGFTSVLFCACVDHFSS